MNFSRYFLRMTLSTSMAAICALSSGVYAQNQPTLLKQVTIVVPFPAGGATDGVARLVGERLRGTYAENVVIENRAGAAGRIGVEYVKNRPADGTTLLFTPAFPMIISPHVYKNITYNTMRDFVPVATTSKGVLALSVGPAVPANVTNLSEFITWVKANPTKANFGGPGGSSQHFAGVMFAKSAGINLPLISYKGGAPSVIDVLGGHIASVITPLPEVLQHANEGKLRILATTSSIRSRFVPNIPTMVESGYKDVIFQDWSGFLMPANTPAEWVARAGAAISRVVASDSGADALAKFGTEADVQTPAQFAVTVRNSWEHYRSIVQSTGFVAED